VRSGFRLSLVHLVVFVGIAVVFNGQFTWWIVHSLRSNRERLDLEREVTRLHARLAAVRLELGADRAAAQLISVAGGALLPRTEAFTDVRVRPSTARREPLALVPSPRDGAQGFWQWRRDASGRVTLEAVLRDGRTLTAVLDPQAPQRWLAAIDPRLELRPIGERRGEPAPVPLGGALEGMAVVPDAARWERVLVEYRRRVMIVVVEGVLFFAAMITTVIVLWTVLRREGALQRQSQNFISAVTHELKTPIAGMRVALETVLAGRVDAEGSRHFLGNALADAERLSDLVEKVLDVTRYGSGAHHLRIVPEDLSELISGEVAAAARRARARGVAMEADIAPSIVAPVDAEAIAIVVSNLLENAVKYAQGPPPRVDVSLRLANGEATLEIRDNGIGISEEDRKRIFDAFFRAGDEVTRRTPGTGIGLYVAREIVESHGGRLRVESAGRGKGATFHMVLPGAGEYAEEDLSE
jgi:signal transduction histidine kinase